ncbi:MAG: hypothetical protein BV456_09925 [Thermoplasmata archaeon M8B2D]|nr:MAG: hypothetical protein BV456_09925 [Thermoplasmata archaeon M8B2D]
MNQVRMDDNEYINSLLRGEIKTNEKIMELVARLKNDFAKKINIENGINQLKKEIDEGYNVLNKIIGRTDVLIEMILEEERKTE